MKRAGFAGLRAAHGRCTAFLLAVPMCWVATSAGAITYYNGPAGFGIDPRFAGPADFRIMSADDWRTAGSKSTSVNRTERRCRMVAPVGAIETSRSARRRWIRTDWDRPEAYPIASVKLRAIHR